LVDSRNIDDMSGEKGRAADEAAVGFHTPVRESFSATERRWLLELARKNLMSASASGSVLEAVEKDVPQKLAVNKACFVTLTKEGALRGCVGHLRASGPLHQAVAETTHRAALHDPRFPPVQPDELDQIRIEISVLTEPQPLEFNSPEDLLSKLHPNEDGVLLQIGRSSATFLPQVWEQVTDKVKFLERLAQKAGCAPSAWRGKDVSVSIYHVEWFEEEHSQP
jgi:AmmeMemoRadiSam system protein A